MKAFASVQPLARGQIDDAPLRSLPRPSRLAEPLEVKPKRAAAAAEALGLDTVGDLLEHFPREHADRREAAQIAALPVGEDVTVIAEVRRISSRRSRGRLTVQQATVVDDSGPLKAVWFNQPWLVDKLPSGTRVVLHGRYNGPSRGLSVKDHEVAPDATSAHSTGVVPVYRATEHLSSSRIRELARSGAVHAAAALLGALGGEAYVERGEDTLQLRGYGCPLSAAVTARAEVCRAVEALLSEVIGAPVREQCERGERPRCCFHVGTAA